MDAETQETVEVALKSVQELQEQFNDPKAAISLYREPEILVPTKEEEAELASIEVRMNLEYFDTPEGAAYKKAITSLYNREEVRGNAELDHFKTAFLEGKINKDEFESAFSALFTDIVNERNAERERKALFHANLGIKWYEYPDLNKLNDHIHYDMDLTNHYVEIIREPGTHKITKAHVHKRKDWSDGTPRLYVNDMLPWEKDLYAKFIDLRDTHDDGTLNVEVTVALHEDYYARKQARFIERQGTYKPLMPSVKIGRNDPCVCGSGKKYKKCHFGRTDFVIGTDMATAQKHFGKDFFDFKAPAEDTAEIAITAS